MDKNVKGTTMSDASVNDATKYRNAKHSNSITSERNIKQWRVGVYLRLSKEDVTAGTSVSIDHQNPLSLTS